VKSKELEEKVYPNAEGNTAKRKSLRSKSVKSDYQWVPMARKGGRRENDLTGKVCERTGRGGSAIRNPAKTSMTAGVANGRGRYAVRKASLGVNFRTAGNTQTGRRSETRLLFSQ